MIEDKLLLRISIVCVLCGLGLAYIASILAAPPLLTPKEVTTEHLGKTVILNGTVSSSSTAEGHVFFTLNGSQASIQAVWFNAPQSVPEGVRLQVEGTIDRYQGKQELVVDSVTLK